MLAAQVKKSARANPLLEAKTESVNHAGPCADDRAESPQAEPVNCPMDFADEVHDPVDDLSDELEAELDKLGPDEADLAA